MRALLGSIRGTPSTPARDTGLLIGEGEVFRGAGFFDSAEDVDGRCCAQEARWQGHVLQTLTMGSGYV